jgi:transposase
MKPPAKIKEWLSEEELSTWVREARTRESYQKRLVIWLTYYGSFRAQQTADYLRVSRQAVWLWVGQYNKKGPDGLNRKGRGGRRWSYISLTDEKSILDLLKKRAMEGEFLTAKQILPIIKKKVGKEVSLAYVYRMLHRHGWRKSGPRPHHVKSNKKAQEGFKKNSLR